MKKCKHDNLNTRFLRSKKYNEEELVEYTYCEKCGEVFKGNVSFVQPIEIKKEEPTIIIQEEKKEPVSESEETVFVKKAKPKIKKVVGKPSDKPKVKRNAVQAPEGVSLGDILKVKYEVKDIQVPEKKVTKKNTLTKSKPRFKPMDADSFDDNEDIDIFLK